MDRYVGLDEHAQTCTLAVMSSAGKRLTSKVVETSEGVPVDAVRGIRGEVHLCLEEGAQGAWLHEILSPHVCEIVVTVPEKSTGPKDDLRDAWARAEDIRTGRVRTRVYKAPKHLAALRCAARRAHTAWPCGTWCGSRILSRRCCTREGSWRTRGSTTRRPVRAGSSSFRPGIGSLGSGSGASSSANSKRRNPTMELRGC